MCAPDICLSLSKENRFLCAPLNEISIIVCIFNLGVMEGFHQCGDKENLPFPELDLPKSWWNDDEVSYFFSPFRSNSQNPSDKDNKIKFWMPMILKWCDHKKRCAFTLSELERIFTKNQLVPACLSGVVEEMLRKHQLYIKEEFLLLPPQSWSGWAVDLLIKKPVGWSLRKAKQLIVKTEDEKTYIVMEAVKLQANLLITRVKESSKNSILSKTEVEKLASDLVDLEVILHWLRCHNKIACTNYKEQHLIKICDEENRDIEISETDVGIFALQQTEKRLNNRLEQLEEERLAAIQSAKTYVARGLKQMAKSSLKKKHNVEKSMEKCASVLENVQSLLTRIRESHTDAKIFETYQQGLAALKFTLKDGNLNDENVSNTMLELNEILDIHNEIQESMVIPAGSGSDQELDDELEKLLLSPEIPPVPSSNIDIKDLPDVPQGKIPEIAAKAEAVCL